MPETKYTASVTVEISDAMLDLLAWLDIAKDKYVATCGYQDAQVFHDAIKVASSLVWAKMAQQAITFEVSQHYVSMRAKLNE